MENTILIKRYTGKDMPPVDKSEVWRYSGYFGDYSSVEDQMEEKFEQVVAELLPKLDCKICYRRISLTVEDNNVGLLLKAKSKDLEALLKDCNEAVVFAATIGLEPDKYILRNQRVSVVKALIAQALGAERVESLCNLFCSEIETEAAGMGYFLTERYSPGYGDLPLETQRELFRLLDCSRQVGITLGESLLMTPSKSVTAIFGIGKSKKKRDSGCGKCSECSKTDCEFRR